MRSKVFVFLFIVIFLLILCHVSKKIENYYQTKGEYPPLWIQLLASAGRGHFGTGDFGGTPNDLDLSLLEPGDILLGGNPGGSYGRYTHAGLYIGNNQVVTMYTASGIYLEPPTAYQRYQWAAILRVKASPAQKQAAVSYCRSQVGGAFFILTPKTENGLWYCSKLIWLAYLKQGIDLDPFNFYWVLPDAFIHSPNVEIIAVSEVQQ
ncbi:MAG: hypothetical protein PWP44_228 [Thermacetogenium sp.]|uniref:Uncharacterized protein n=1 Tax=Thermacetogenium phaeum TaxID=85874 RepID=A0A101FHH7_9THEO|nr:MAG: Uncharacterized protein XD66_0147 [Thermacetogenium phaeum]MDN5365025.1 hypothetical protein [Thermacetogenium sp.]